MNNEKKIFEKNTYKIGHCLTLRIPKKLKEEANLTSGRVGMKLMQDNNGPYIAVFDIHPNPEIEDANESK